MSDHNAVVFAVPLNTAGIRLIRKCIVISEDSAVFGFLRNGRRNADNHTVRSLGAIVGVVGSGGLLIALYGIIVHGAFVNFAAQRLQLRHVDGVIISSTAGHICDTAIIFSNCRIAYLVFFIANGYHTIFFCEGLVG